MISQKQITAEEGAGLLDALRGAPVDNAPGRNEPRQGALVALSV